MDSDYIQIKRLDSKRSHRSRTNSYLTSVYFELSAIPSDGWIRCIEHKWSGGKGDQWRDINVREKYIILDVLVHEVEAFVPTLKEVVAETNAQRRIEKAEEDAAAARRAEEKRLEVAKLKELENTLQFDD